MCDAKMFRDVNAERNVVSSPREYTVMVVIYVLVMTGLGLVDGQPELQIVIH